MLERYNKIESRESSRSNPVCSNPVIRGDKLPEHLKREVLNSFPYRWTKENEGRARYFYKYGKVDPPRSELISDEQWLREHAFHVTKAGKLDARHAHAEPHFMADDWKKGDPKPNPLTIEESREIEHLARRERIIGEQIQSPGSRGYHIGRAEGMRDIRSRYGRVRPNPLLQTVFAANPPASPAALKRQMIAFLKKEFRHIHSDINSKDAEFEIEGAIYWFANDYHGGGGSALYSILSTSPFKPGPSVRGPEEGIEQMMYDTLEQKYGGKKNPPISSQWDTMTKRQRLAVMEVAGYEGSYAVNRSWATLDPSMRRNIEQLWLDTTSRGGTTRRRRAVAVNPLTHRESTQILKRANNNLRTAQVFRPGHTRSEKSGQAFARGMVVKQYGPPKAKRVAGKVITRAQKVAGTTLSNPGTLRLPKPGTKMTVAQALELARRIGDKSLIAQCHQAMKLQKKANKGAKCVIWKTLAIGSPNKIDTVVALTHYGDSPETMYRPPKGSKKGPHMYRHKWGEGGGAKKTVPLLASADGKALLMPLDGKKIASDWLRH
jgi:hypothetical protein